jgi:serine/threonine-protein kinase
MSPEQARGEEDIDHRADIWSFCVMLYEIVAGQAPFQGQNYNALLRAILESEAPTLEKLSAADRELSRTVEIGMTKDRAERWQSMPELGGALARWLIQQDVFEDAAGGSLEMKWVNRRTDPSYRGSRPSLGSIPEILPVRSTATSSTQPGIGARRALSEAPASVGPVVTPSMRAAKRRFVLPAVAAAVALAAVLLFWLRGSPADEPAPALADRTVAPPLAAPLQPAPTATSPAPSGVAQADRPSPSALPSNRERSPAAQSRKGARPAKPTKPGKTAAPASKTDDLMRAY